jgi:hypothetical protein
MRMLRIGLLAIGLVLFGALVALLRPWRCPVNGAAAGQIDKGMTQAEVEEVLGGPPGDYTTRPGGFLPLVFNSAGLEPRESWHGDECVVHVTFQDGKVSRVEVVKVGPRNTGLIDLLQWRLTRLKECLFP